MRGAFATRPSAADRASVSVISLTARLQRKIPGPKAEIEKKRDRRCMHSFGLFDPAQFIIPPLLVK